MFGCLFFFFFFLSFFSPPHCLVSSVLSAIETVLGFRFRNRDDQTVMGFGVGAGKCRKVTREKN